MLEKGKVKWAPGMPKEETGKAGKGVGKEALEAVGRAAEAERVTYQVACWTCVQVGHKANEGKCNGGKGLGAIQGVNEEGGSFTGAVSTGGVWTISSVEAESRFGASVERKAEVGVVEAPPGLDVSGGEEPPDVACGWNGAVRRRKFQGIRLKADKILGGA